MKSRLDVAFYCGTAIGIIGVILLVVGNIPGVSWSLAWTGVSLTLAGLITIRTCRIICNRRHHKLLMEDVARMNALSATEEALVTRMGAAIDTIEQSLGPGDSS